jgi:hypothetical protein
VRYAIADGRNFGPPYDTLYHSVIFNRSQVYTYRFRFIRFELRRSRRVFRETSRYSLDLSKLQFYHLLSTSQKQGNLMRRIFAWIMTWSVRRFMRVRPRFRKPSRSAPSKRVRLALETCEDRNMPGSAVGPLALVFDSWSAIGQLDPVAQIFGDTSLMRPLTPARFNGATDFVAPSTAPSPTEPTGADSFSNQPRDSRSRESEPNSERRLDQSANDSNSFLPNYAGYDSRAFGLPEMSADSPFDHGATHSVDGGGGGGGGGGSDAGNSTVAGFGHGIEQSPGVISDGSSSTSQPISPLSSTQSQGSASSSAATLDALRSLLNSLSASSSVKASPVSEQGVSIGGLPSVPVTTPGISSSATTTSAKPIQFTASVINGAYTAQGSNYSIALDSTGIAFSPSNSSGSIRLSFVGAKQNATAQGLDPIDANFKRVTYSSVWSGIDVSYYSNQRNQVEFDFTIAPGSDPSQIQTQIQGAASLAVDQDGSLSVRLPDGNAVVEQTPTVFQTVNGVQQSIAGKYILLGDNRVGFALGTYDHSLPLVIDPAVLNVPGSQVTLPNNALKFSAAIGNAVTVSDSGASTTPLTVALSVSHGSISLSRTTNLTFSSGTGTNDTSMRFTGVAADVNTALDGLVYVPEHGFSGNDAIAIQVDDPDSLAGNQSPATGSVAILVALAPNILVSQIYAAGGWPERHTTRTTSSY